jgi:hypothetical protein
MDFKPKIVNFQMVLNLVDVYQYHSPPKKSLQNSIDNLNFEVYLEFFMFCDVYFSNTNILHMSKFANFCCNLFLYKLI